MHKNIILIFLFLVGTIAQAQTSNQNKENTSGGNGIVKGKVVDGKTGKPMEFVNAALYKSKDSVLLTGSITDKKGNFKITGINAGTYYVEVNFIGFHKKHITGIEIKKNQRKADLGKINLKPSNKELEGVEVVAEDQRIEYKIDKKIINVSQDLNASGGSAVDVLKNTPSVEVDIEGNVTLRGSSSFTVLIDGKPTTMDGNDILKQLPVSSIQKIEIITNPSVKYDPEGGSGIINVITKKRKREGFNGIVNLSAGTRDKYSGDFLLNYRKGKTNWYVGGDYSDRKFYMDGVMERETYGDTTFIVNSERERIWKRSGKSANAGLDYHFTDNQTLSLTTKIGEYGFGFDIESNTKSYSRPSDGSTQYTKEKSIFDRSGFYWEGTANYEYQIDSSGQKLDARIFYSRHLDDELETQDTYLTNSDYEPLDPDNSDVVRTTEDENSTNIRMKANYTLPVNATMELETGLQSRINNEGKEYSLETFDPVGSGIDNEAFRSRNFDFNQQIHAAYATLSKDFGFVNMKAGLRDEYTKRELINRDTSETYGIDRIDWFPSLHLSKKFKNKHQLQASFARRINRPRGWYLDPFLSYRDQYTLRKGDPNLEPEYTNSYELTYLKHFKKGFISFESYFRQTTNRIERTSEVYNQDMVIMTFKNVNRDQAYGSELMFNMPVTEWFKLNISGTLYRFKIFTKENGENITRKDNNWNTRINTTFEITSSTKLQLRAFYNAPKITSTGTRGDFFMSSAAVRQNFLNDQLNLVLRVKDIFATRGHDITTIRPSYRMSRSHKHTQPIVNLSLTYKINNFKQKKQDRDSEREGMEMSY